ncbi:WXG100 family type VII secretion target [Actinoplanes sp. NPDC048796]|uniref:WXG100 family type VII secretion target n=1 Tax=Actinoplanes sp. NPDC048796 TaxID=3155640 RepID=UPI003401823E
MPDVENTRIEVPHSITEAPAYLTTVAQHLQEELDTLAGKLAPLKEQWIGQSGQAYTDVSELWNADAIALFSPVEGVLKQIADAVRVVAENYDLVEDGNRRSWSTS